MCKINLTGKSGALEQSEMLLTIELITEWETQTTPGSLFWRGKMTCWNHNAPSPICQRIWKVQYTVQIFHMEQCVQSFGRFKLGGTSQHHQSVSTIRQISMWHAYKDSHSIPHWWALLSRHFPHSLRRSLSLHQPPSRNCITLKRTLLTTQNLTKHSSLLLYGCS